MARATLLPMPPNRSTVPTPRRSTSSTLPSLDLAPFRHDHDAEVASRGLPAPDLGADLLDIEGDLGNEDDVGAAGQSAVERDPAGVAAHQLDHHDPVVALRGGVQPVDRLGGGADGGIEPEGALGAAHVVVDGLGNADDREALLPQLVGDLQAPVAADGDQGVESAGLERRHQVIGAVDLTLRAVGGAHDVAKRGCRGWWCPGWCRPGG